VLSLNRVTNVWTSLPIKLITSPFVNFFKKKLDKQWHNQEAVSSCSQSLETDVRLKVAAFWLYGNFVKIYSD